jgi:hypothetical protein
VQGNVPLAAAYLKLYAQIRGLGAYCDIDIVPAAQANTWGDRALVAALVDRRPWMVGFTCYVWNIERTLWIARELKQRLPSVRVVLGGPEITPDNFWVLESPDYDFAVIGEGEQTFTELIIGLHQAHTPTAAIPGLYVPPRGEPSRYDRSRLPAFRTPMADLNQLGSPYLAGILDAADEKILLLETTRGCVFKCKFCYYPKSYVGQYYLSRESILSNLQHARDRGAREVFLLDPTLNQRRDFAEFLRLLAEGNPDRAFSYFGELRGEGINPETARLLREANFTEVEVGLQSIDPAAQEKMDRKNNLKAFERGVSAMLHEGINVTVDLIVGLPGDTPESVRRGLRYLHESELYTKAQVFNLSILPGTAFRQEATMLGLKFQPRPPYYALQTPTLRREEMFELLQEAQDLFTVEYDAQPPPLLALDDFSTGGIWQVDLDSSTPPEPPAAERRAQAFTLWLRSNDFNSHSQSAAGKIRRVLDDNPFTTLQVVLEPAPSLTPQRIRATITERLLETLISAGQAHPTYLDRYYSLQPGRINGAKRLILLLPLATRSHLGETWAETMGEFATLLWRGSGTAPQDADLQAYEYAWTT